MKKEIKQGIIVVILLLIVCIQTSILISCNISEEKRMQMEIEATQEGQVAREYEEMQLQRELEEHEQTCDNIECTYENCKNNKDSNDCTQDCADCNCCKCDED